MIKTMFKITRFDWWSSPKKPLNMPPSAKERLDKNVLNELRFVQHFVPWIDAVTASVPTERALLDSEGFHEALSKSATIVQGRLDHYWRLVDSEADAKKKRHVLTDDKHVLEHLLAILSRNAVCGSDPIDAAASVFYAKRTRAQLLETRKELDRMCSLLEEQKRARLADR